MKNLLFFLCIGLAGCATNASNGNAPDASVHPKHGWVSFIYSADTPAAALPKCLADLPPGEIAARHFVKIDYRHVRRMLVEVAEIPDTANLQTVRIGDHVELIPGDCDAGRLSRITSFLH